MLLLVLALAAAFAWREITSPDFGFHVAAGRLILERGAWPQRDPFTFTVPDHPYVDMNGLFQVLLALLDRAAGTAGVGLLQLVLVEGAVLLLWATARRRGVSSPALLGVGFGLAVLAWEPRFLHRPELATFLFLAFELYALQRHRADGRAIWLMALAPLQILWVNSHSLSLLGPATLALYALAGLADKKRRPDKSPWLALGVVSLCLFANPYGWTGVRFLFQLSTRLEGGNIFGEMITELRSPFAAAPDRPALAFFVFAGLTVLVALLGRRGLTAFDVLLIAVYGALAAVARRNIPLFLMSALPAALAAAECASARFALRRPGRSGGRPARWTATAAVSAGLAFATSQAILGGYYLADFRPHRFGAGLSAAANPIACTDFIVRRNIPGPIFNHLRFGGYLEARLWPREKVFIDGRLEVIEEQLFREYVAANRGPGWPAMVDRWDPNLALIALDMRRQFERLVQDPQWALVEVDGVAALFLRRRPENRSIIDAARQALAQEDQQDPRETAPAPRPPMSWLLRLGRRSYPFDALARGNALFSLGYFEAARREYARGLREAGYDEPDLALSYAEACARLNRGAEAQLWREAARRGR